MTLQKVINKYDDCQYSIIDVEFQQPVYKDYDFGMSSASKVIKTINSTLKYFGMEVEWIEERIIDDSEQVFHNCGFEKEEY